MTQKVSKAYQWPSDDPEWPYTQGIAHQDDPVIDLIGSVKDRQRGLDQLRETYREAEVTELKEAPPREFVRQQVIEDEAEKHRHTVVVDWGTGKVIRGLVSWARSLEGKL